MKLNLEQIFINLVLPLGLIAVFATVLSLFGVSLDMVQTIAASMIGAELLISLTVNVLKWAGVVTDGTAGKWSAALSLGFISFIAVTLIFNPLFDFTKLDADLVVVAKFLTLVFSYVVQIANTKFLHKFTAYGLGVKAFRFS